MALTYQTNPAWTHAGGVTYRRQAGRTEILLVRASPPPHQWVVPKGHIDAGEPPHDCARREIREEAGVDAAAVAFLGEDAFTTSGGKAVNAAFFLMRYLREVPPTEDRPRRWCTFAEALASIEFDNMRAIIRGAEARVVAGRSERAM